MPARSIHTLYPRHAKTKQRDWKLAAFGGGCSLLGAACLLLAACSTQPAKPQNPAPPPLATPSPDAVAAGLPTVAPAAAPPVPFWVALRARFAMPGCEYNTAVMRWAHWYTENPSGFTLSVRQSLPLLMLVAERLAQRDIPGEFAFLPYIESNYMPLESSGKRAAGIWQLMPDTAREAGLPVGRSYDGRLDIAASTDAALQLLGHYHDVFDSWRLADMAFNAGEFAVRRHFDGENASYSATELSRLQLRHGAHDHLAKLLAMACIVRDPTRFAVQLPEPEAGDYLVQTVLPAALDLQLAARLAGLDAARLRQLNRGFRKARMPAAGPFHLLLPRTHGDALQAGLNAIPQALWSHWHAITLRKPETVGVLASAYQIDEAVLAAANAIGVDAQLAAGAQVLLPGRGEADLAPTLDASADTHIVRAGDTLWDIARGAHVSVPELRRWNGLTDNARLRIGQHLRLQAAHAAGATGTVAASAH